MGCEKTSDPAARSIAVDSDDGAAVLGGKAARGGRRSIVTRSFHLCSCSGLW